MAHPKASSFFIILMLLGCASTQKVDQPTLSQQARIWIDQSPALEVLNAAAGEKELYLTFRAYSKDSDEFQIFNAYATWDPRKRPVDLSADLVVPLEMIQGEDPAPEEARAVVSLSEEHWREFRSELAVAITPQVPGTGVVLRSHENELILFYDAEDQLQIIDLKEKPAAIKIGETLSQENQAQRIVMTMEKYLSQKNIQTRRVLLLVDNEEDYTTPFLYVDLDEKTAVNLKLPTGQEDRYREGLIKKGIKSADYLLLDSYVLGLVKRPVSSSVRLFSWGQGIPRDLLKPPALGLFENKPLPAYYDGDGMDLSAFQEKLEKQIGKKSSSGEMQFLIDGDEFFTQLIDAIIGAKESIDIRIFIFDNDDYARSIADLLKKRSNEGIKVRVLLDGMGQVMGETKLPESMPAGYIPPPSMAQYLREDSTIEVRVRPNAWFKADHTKTIVIDQEMFFTGGMNIGREYRYDWHDLMMSVRGPLVHEILNEFEIAWAHAGPWGDLGYLKTFLRRGSEPGAATGVPMQTLYTRLNDPQIFKAQLLAIQEAKRYIYVHNAYFSDDTTINELIKARRRGVDVRVIIPFNGNHSIMNASNVVTANTLFRHGIRVYFFPKMSHVKAAIYDGWLCTGSANFDKLSLIDNLELNLASADPAMVQDFKTRLFETDFARSMEMKEPLAAGWRQKLAELVAEHL